MVIYLGLIRIKQTQIEEMTDLNRKTIENILSMIQDVMAEDLDDEDVQIGKNKSHFLSFFSTKLIYV
jgi:hypothetical protein